ncbi:MAG: hypothetical protein GF334_06165 [Candidatus Altiarchaeales archaeon]|nr:hypothetical protein [Candidatus Altiarchaeales archaeon]
MAKYVSIESTTCFSFGNLVRKVKAEIRKKFPNAHDKEFEKLIYNSLRTFTLNGQEFDYEASPNHLGGVRWYVKCPKCGSPRLKLYLPSKYKDREQLYLCQACHKLKNHSLLLGTSKKYKKVIRPLIRLEKIRRILLRKSMTPEKAKPYLEEYERIEKDLAVSPEYRLWKFQREHGKA